MSQLKRRLRRLETTLLDGSGLVPHSAAWMKYWVGEVRKMVAGERADDQPLIPLEAVRAYMRDEPIP